MTYPVTIVDDFFDDPDEIVKLAEDMKWYPPCLLYTSPSPRDKRQSRMPSSA